MQEYTSIKVGEKFPMSEIQSMQEGVTMLWTRDIGPLFICKFFDVTPEERELFFHGEGEIACDFQDGLIQFGIKFTDNEQRDTIVLNHFNYNVHRIGNPEEQPAPETPREGDAMAMTIVLLEGRGTITQAIRVFSISTQMTKVLITLLSRQKQAPRITMEDEVRIQSRQYENDRFEWDFFENALCRYKIGSKYEPGKTGRLKEKKTDVSGSQEIDLTELSGEDSFKGEHEGKKVTLH